MTHAGPSIAARRRILPLLLFAVVAALCATGALAGPITPPDLTSLTTFSGGATAPEFPQGEDWLNVAQPLTMRGLRGKVTLLVFWRAGCINCQQLLPNLKHVQAKYGSALAVVGVHAGKFKEEQETGRIRDAVLREGITFPVINDKHLLLWRAYSVYAWPTAVLITPEGTVVGQVSGQGACDALDRAIGAVMHEASAKGPLNTAALPLRPEHTDQTASLLDQPGKVLADGRSDRLFIADTNHNRIVIASRQDGAVLAIIGDGEPGLRDGSFEAAQFSGPQGMALKGADTLYVADTQNQAVREVDLQARTVSTVAGPKTPVTQPKGTAPSECTGMSAPWDLVVSGNALFIAMAGAHQVWRLDLQTHELSPFAGTGREALIDGARTGAALAQPVGITASDDKLFTADCESSAIRAVDINGRARVETVAGGGLFQFGDRDGTGPAARLQYPMGVAYQDGELYVADTYNHRIKKIATRDGAVESWLGTGEAGLRDGEQAEFREPSGVSAAGGKLYIADRGNDAIRVADLRTGEVDTFQLHPEIVRAPAAPEFSGRVVELPEQTVGTGAITMALSLDPPAAEALDQQAPNEVTVRVEGEPAAKGRPIEKRVENPQFPLRLPLWVLPGRGAVSAELRLHYHLKGAETKREDTRVVVPLTVEKTSRVRTVKVPLGRE